MGVDSASTRRTRAQTTDLRRQHPTGDRLGELGAGPRRLSVDQFDEQPRQVAEHLIDQRPIDAGLRCDAVRRCRVEPFGVDDRVRDVEDLLAPPLGGHAPLRVVRLHA